MSPLKEVGTGLESVMQSEVGQRRTDVYSRIHVESRTVVQMNLFAGQE